MSDGLVRRRSFTAVKMISKATSEGLGDILPATTMDTLYTTRPANFVTSVGASLNYGTNVISIRTALASLTSACC